MTLARGVQGLWRRKNRWMGQWCWLGPTSMVWACMLCGFGQKNAHRYWRQYLFSQCDGL